MTYLKLESSAAHNVFSFSLFRMFFSARFYYPVYALLFLDFGLTLEQFGILNGIWAVTIVLCEVPSGALADTIGRRTLLIAAGILMFFEIIRFYKNCEKLEIKKQTFISKMGIYDSNKNLIAIVNMARPIRKKESDEYTFKINLDI